MAELKHLEAAGFIQRCPGDIVRYTPHWRAVGAVPATRDPVFPPLVCIRALEVEEKARTVYDQVRNLSTESTFLCNPAAFAEIPGSPFSYWTRPRIRQLFQELDQFEDGDRVARLGMNTADNFRFIRATWEVCPLVRKNTWVPFAKGGTYAPFYADIALVVNWQNDGCEMKAWIETLPGCSHWSRRIASAEYYFRPGLTWPLRAASFSPQAMPYGCIFSVRGYAVLAKLEELPALLGFTASSAFDYLFKIMLGRFAFPEFVVGILQKLPMPKLSDDSGRQLSSLSELSWKTKRTLDSTNLNSNAFILPAFLTVPGTTLAELATSWAATVRTSKEAIAATQSEINDIAFRLYGFDTVDRAAIAATLTTEPTADADVEAGEDEEVESATADAPSLTAAVLDYALGVAFGRWDVRVATGQKPAPPEPALFEPLPICPPGQFQNEEGLPITKEDAGRLKEEGRWNYPIEIPWDGILVDDPGHPLDFEARIHQVLQVIWKDGWEAIEREAREILGVRNLRDYFRKPAGFFADHLTRYSKSRRRAPIYWELATWSHDYAVWLYYHRFTRDTFYKVLGKEFLGGKLVHEEQRLARMRAEVGESPARAPSKELEAQEAFVAELTTFREEIERIAPLWNPDLNDGVIINFALLWRLVPQHKAWQKECKECWDSLVAGDYDWAHLAMHLWPERVVPKCRDDRSLAIAHGLEDVFWNQGTKGKWAPRDDVTQAQVDALVADRIKPAVKAALESLLSAPTSGSGTSKKRRKK